jgi:thioredoxin-dependent peroxiredoxin
MRLFSGVVAGTLAMTLAAGVSVTEVAAQEVVLNVGDRAPIFEGRADNGEIWRSREHVGRSVVVVYFYPAAMTAGCTTQACLFRDNRSVLQELGAEVIGVSGDRIDALRAFKGVNRLNFELVSDTAGVIAEAFGVPTRAGGTITREVEGDEVTLTRDLTMARWTFVIDRDGRISYKETDVNPEGDPEAVIHHLRGMAADR